MNKLSPLLPFIAFIAYLLKTMVIPASFPDAIVVCSLISYIILNQLSLKDKTLAKYDAAIKELKDIQSVHDTRIQALQSSNSAMKASVGMRQILGPKV